MFFHRASFRFPYATRARNSRWQTRRRRPQWHRTEIGNNNPRTNHQDGSQRENGLPPFSGNVPVAGRSFAASLIFLGRFALIIEMTET